MSQDWNLVPLSQIISERQEVPSVDALIKGEICIIEKIGFNDGKIQLRSNTTTKTNMILIQPGDLVVSGINAAKGAIAVFDENNTVPIAATIHYSSYIINKQKADIRYLWWLLRSHKFKELLLEYVPGGIKTELKAKRLLPVPIPLPLLEEQRRIVARVEEMVGKIEEVRSLRQKALEESNLIYKNLVRQIFDNYTESSISIEKLVGRANLKNGKSIRATEQASGIKCIRLSAIRDGQVDCTDSKPVPMSAEEAQQYLVKPEDVFIVRGNGSKHLVGQAGIIKKFVKGTIFPDLFIQVPLDSHKILPSFFVAWWNNPLMRDKIIEVAKTTSGIWKINQGHIAGFSIPVLPLPEQRRIVTYLDELQTKVDTMKHLRKETIKELDALLPSILDKAFKGQL